MRGNLRAHLQDHRSLCTLAHLPSVKAGCVRAGACPSARAGAPSGKVRPTEGPCRYPPSRVSFFSGHPRDRLLSVLNTPTHSLALDRAEVSAELFARYRQDGLARIFPPLSPPHPPQVVPGDSPAAPSPAC